MAQNTDNRKRYDKYRDPVRELRTPEEKRNARVLATCGECGRSWDDAVVTSMTPAPGGRCPFEALHERSDWQAEAPTTSEMEALAGMQDEDDELRAGLRGADRAEWVLAKASSEDVSGLDLRDQVTDMIADLLLLVHRDRPDLDALRILAHAVSHMQTEIHPDGEDDPLYATSVMGTEGDGWEVQLHDGRTVRMVVKA